MPAGNTGIATTVPYLGQLFQTVRRPNALLKLLGHFTGKTVGEPFAYKESSAIVFPIGAFYTLPSPSQPARLEGANAPAANYFALTQAQNVIQIFTEAVQVTYLAQSDKAISGVVPIPQGEAQGEVQNPRSTAFQVMRTLEKIAQDVNYSMINGTYSNPGDPSATALAMRGVYNAIATNIVNNSASTAISTAANAAAADAIYRGWIDALLLSMIQYNGYEIDDTYALFVGAQEFANIAKIYSNFGTIYLQPEASIAGVKIRKVFTTFGTLMLVLDPDVPANSVLCLSLSQMGLIGLPVPGKGVLFEEPLFKQGSADQTQIYGQLSIDHGPEYLHGLLKVPAGTAAYL